MREFSDNDIKYAAKFDISEEDLKIQFQRLRTDFPKVNLLRPAIIGDGIIRLSSDEENYYSSLFIEEKENYSLIKFTPASGAASRMFLPFTRIER